MKEEKKRVDEFFFPASISLMLTLTVIITLFMVNAEQMKENRQVEKEKELVQECLHRLTEYCKGRKEEGQIKGDVCPILRDSAYLWGHYTCKNGLVNLYLSSESLVFTYEKGTGRYEWQR
ncbi:MAG: hypothetical protein QW212_01130 [Nitrososphaerales archaeon]